MLKNSLFFSKWEHLIVFIDLRELREIDYGSERKDLEDREEGAPILKQVV